jgi:DNA replication protein
MIKKQDKSKIVQIWGDILDEGFTSVPNILLRYRSNLGVKSHHLALIIDIMSFKWDEENPFPSYSTLAQRANVTERGIMKTVRDLERLNLLIRTQRFDEESGVQITTIFDFRPLIQRLKEEMHKAEIEHEPGITNKTRARREGGGTIVPGEGELQFRGEGEIYFTQRILI